jgi:hypothetical protein
MAQTFIPTVSLQSYNYDTMYVRHQNFAGELTKIDSDLDRQDATFRPQESNGAIRFEAGYIAGKSLGSPFYLRHQDFVVTLQQEDMTFEPGQPPSPAQELFIQDSSFNMVFGLADVSYVSFQSVNYRTRYLRHRDFKLYIEPIGSDLDKADATFRIVTGLMPIPAPVIK